MLLLVRAPPKEKAGMGDIEIVEGSDSKILHRRFSPEDKLVMKFVDRSGPC
jgi:hypothetical protein